MVHFSRQGLSGARVVDIIGDARLSHRMLYHYFTSKEQLYVATLEYAYAKIRAAEQELQLDKLSPPMAMRRLVEFTFDYYVTNPQFMALLSQENLNGGTHVVISDARRLQSPLIETLTRQLERGIAEGSFRGAVDPVNLYIDIAGLCYFALSNRHTLAAIFDPDIESASFLERRRAHVSEFVVRALSAISRPT
jgi:AcrR family transcriptional regulator